MINGKKVDINYLRGRLQPVRNFQLAYGVPIYVGEFSAIRWAPGAAEYLSDCISIFEEYGWDVSYHAFREWDGWSVEHGEKRQDTAKTQNPTRRKQIITDWLKLNAK